MLSSNLDGPQTPASTVEVYLDDGRVFSYGVPSSDKGRAT